MRWTIPDIPRPHAEQVLRRRAYLPESVTLRRTVWKAVIGQGGFVLHLSRRTPRGTMVWESLAVLRAAVDTTSDRGAVVLTASRLAWCVLPGLAGLGLLGFAGAVGVTVARDRGPAFWPQACVGAIARAPCENAPRNASRHAAMPSGHCAGRRARHASQPASSGSPQ